MLGRNDIFVGVISVRHGQIQELDILGSPIPHRLPCPFSYFVHSMQGSSNYQWYYFKGGLQEDLRYDGETCSLNRVARLMQNNGIVGIPAKKQWRRRKSCDRPDDIINHLNRDFSASDVNSKWGTDITYVRTGEGWLYLAVVVDLCHGQIVGWSMSHRMETQLVIQAVLMALWQKKDQSSVILHSDRGSQFTSHEYQCFLKYHNITSSMSAVGSCYDNAAAESFFGLLKRERVNRRRYVTRTEARADIFDYIERFYNQRKKRKLEKNVQTALNWVSGVSG